MPPNLKTQIIERAKGQCEYCRTLLKFSAQPFTIDHILPKSLGGKSELNNLALACGGCNGYKYAKIRALDPVSGEYVPLYHPRDHIWSDHFAWNQAYTHMVGTSPIGRATVLALKLNRPGLVNLREICRLIGEHPPIN